jgi:hypothetical protein
LNSVFFYVWHNWELKRTFPQANSVFKICFRLFSVLMNKKLILRGLSFLFFIKNRPTLWPKSVNALLFPLPLLLTFLSYIINKKNCTVLLHTSWWAIGAETKAQFRDTVYRMLDWADFWLFLSPEKTGIQFKKAFY